MMAVYIEGIKLALDQLQEAYYGSMCSGYMNVLKDDPKLSLEEYFKMSDLCVPIITFYWKEKFSQSYLDLLEDLRPTQYLIKLLEDSNKMQRELKEETLIRVQKHIQYLDDDIRFMINDLLALHYQLPLPFKDLHV
jgi:hypothetical protein